MAAQLTPTLSELLDKIELLSARDESLREEIEKLRSENSDLRHSLKETSFKLESARLDAEFLKVSHRLADSPDTLIDARRLIKGLIRRLDSCIALLNE